MNTISFAYRTSGFSGYTVSAVQHGQPAMVDVVRIDVPRAVRNMMPGLEREIADLVRLSLQRAYGTGFPAIEV